MRACIMLYEALKKRRKKGRVGLEYPAFEKPFPGLFVPFAYVGDMRHMRLIVVTKIIHKQPKGDIF